MSRSTIILLVIFFLSMLLPFRVFGGWSGPGEKPLALYKKKVFTSRDGLPQNTVTAIARTPEGFVWLASNGGLARFDGGTFDVFRSDNTPGMGGDMCGPLVVDRDGRLWVGTLQNGLLRFYNGVCDGNFTTADGLWSNNVFKIAADPEGGLWVGTDRGLNRLSNENGTVTMTKLAFPGGLGKEICSLAMGNGGRVWVGTRDGLWSVPGDGGTLERFGFEGHDVAALAVGADGALWVGTNGAGLFRVDKGGERKSYNTTTGLSSDLIYTLYWDDEGILWIGTRDGGLNRLKGDDISVFGTAEGLSLDFVTALYRDPQGNIWVGTNGGGLNLLSDSMIITYHGQNGLSSDQVYGLCTDRDGQIWVGTFGAGVNCIKDGRVVRNLTTKDGLPSDKVIALCAGPDGEMWFGTYGAGLARMKDGKIKIYTTEDGLADNVIFALHRDRTGKLWIGTGKGGIHRMDNGRVTRFRDFAGRTRTFLEDRRGYLWVGGDPAGVARLKIGDGPDVDYPVFGLSHGLSSRAVMCIHEDRTGTIWVATGGGGLNRFSEENGVPRFRALRKTHGLPHDILFWILEDGDGHLWFSSLEGIFRIRREHLGAFFNGGAGTVTCRLFNEYDGMKVRECNGSTHAAGLRTEDGRLWFITAAGVSVFDPYYLLVHCDPLPVVIKHVSIDGQSYLPRGRLKVPPGKGDIRIDYTGISYNVPERVQIRYQLEGYDDQWVGSNARRTAYYTNIPGGNYRFRIQARGGEGSWTGGEKPLEIIIETHFYRTGWFKVLVGIGVLLLGWWGYRLRMRRILRRRGQLEALVAERTANLKIKTHELETVNGIVDIINTETDPRAILSAILKETAQLERSRRAGALVYDGALGAYTFKASLGYDMEALAAIRFTYGEAEDRYVKGSHRIAPDIFIVRDAANRPGEHKVASLGIPRSMLVMRIPMDEGKPGEGAAGYLVFDHSRDAATFEKGEVEVLVKLKSHIASAFIKSKLLLELGAGREAAEAGNHSKSMFLARMSHEIRTPMNSVLGFADMLADTGLSEVQREFTRNITRCGESLLYLIDQVLDFSRIEAGELSFRAADFDLEETLLDVCRSMGPGLGDRPVEILCRAGGGLPLWVRSDEGRIRQVLVNLMGNAVKFTHAGEIEVTLAVDEGVGPRMKIHVTVRDTGIGIAPGRLGDIFKVFRQADGSVSPRYGGTGLGLAICKQIAALMGGDVWAESREGEGSTFHFTAWVEAAEERGLMSSAAVEALNGARVLVVEHNPVPRDILRETLKRLSTARVEGMAGPGGPGQDDAGQNVLERLRRGVRDKDPYHLCILGIRGGEGGSARLAGRIRAGGANEFETTALLGILSLTAADGVYGKARFGSMGFDRVLTGPVHRLTLIKTIGQMLQGESKMKSQMKEVSEKALRENTNAHVSGTADNPVQILLAEDNPLNQKLAQFMFSRGGYGLDVVNNGLEAVEVYASQPERYDLIFMDVNMPEMDGREATRTLRDRGFSEVPIIAMTAHALKEDRKKCFEAGMSDYVTKPIKREVVFDMVQKWLLKGRGESG